MSWRTRFWWKWKRLRRKIADLNKKVAWVGEKIDEEKISTIPPSINIQAWQNISKIDLCTKFDASRDSIFILYIGYKSDEKGIFFLIESIKDLWKKDFKIELITVGLESTEFQNYLKSQNPKIQKQIDMMEIHR